MMLEKSLDEQVSASRGIGEVFGSGVVDLQVRLTLKGP